MNAQRDTISVDVRLSEHGDALIYGVLEGYGYVPGLLLKHRLFAWHEASFYGTNLDVSQVELPAGVDLVRGKAEIVILPAEHVLAFFAEPRLLRHVEWRIAGEGRLLARWAPVLAGWIEERRYMPSLDDYRRGLLRWTWEGELPPADREAEDGETASADPADGEWMQGLRAAFSAAVRERHYGTETGYSDLRREYPLLFDKSAASAAGMDERAWLEAIGWRPDMAPFRPILRLLEPYAAGNAPDDWRLQLALQSKRDETIVHPAKLGADGSVSGRWPAAWNEEASERAPGWLDRLRAALPPERLAGGPRDLLGAPLDDEAAWRFLSADSNRLLEAGWRVLLPAWWEAATRKKPRLRAKIAPESGGKGSSLFGLDAIIDFDWRVAIGDLDLSEEEFAALVARNQRLVRHRGQWIALDPALLSQIRRMMTGMDKHAGLSFQDVLQLHLLGEGEDADDAGTEESAEASAARVRLEVELNEHLASFFAQLGRPSEWPLPEPPPDLQATLRTYQREGFGWLTSLRRFGLGAVLADDMGLGKTVQLIAYLLQLRHDTPPERRRAALIVCPTSVLGNWQKEIARFAPSLTVSLHYGGGRITDAEAFGAQAASSDVVLTSFATASLDQELLQTYVWAAICLDEAQNIKNAQTKQSVAVRSLSAGQRIALTGTPIENRLAELWSIYDFIAPGYLGTQRAFQERFATPIERNHDERRTAELKRLVGPFMLRRKKKDPNIQLDLPDKNEMKTYVPLTPEQSALYEQTVNELLERMKALEGIERKGAILAALTRLKQVCDHPALLNKEQETTAAAASADKKGRAGGAESASPGKSPDKLPSKSPGKSADEASAPSEAELAELVSRSAKLERLLAMVKELRDEGDRCLIFTQYVGMGEMLRLVLSQELGEPVLYLNGSTSKTARDRMIERFQSQTLPQDEQPSVFILSLKAGGVGLNLTAANHVFHFDRWWNPAVENQATDRAYRMGQTKDVQVHKFISLGTLEERIDEMLESKQQLSDNVISSSEGWITELSTDDLRDLITLRRGMNG
ncbi:DEAD/DEAH box helicase [Cohnella ginsengisoli]|uniref:DEAD/DEAH box helicase n=1 Tax=Cohnella ginsengisoli TaxID=425004 RepID=A0A9X4KJ02_9BACL|nr:DEAD/DEAH box helicase [Cohnella ginsengisoli]MDG0792851.1 DEAD/DEAH box helicase [Cohnella ginsengisoli]